MSLTIVQGDLLTQRVDAIVNPANGHLRHGGGLAAKIAAGAVGGVIAHDTALNALRRESIHTRGGWTAVRAQWEDDHANAPLIATGDAYLTSAGCLPFKGVIHAVGPIWGGGGFYEDSLLTRAHDSACQLAIRSGFASLAIPAISCGIFRYPVEDAANVAVATALSYTRMLDIRFVLFEDAHYAAYSAQARRWGL